MSGSVRLGLFGAGRIGQVHARSVVAAQDAQLAAIADPDETAAATVARLTGARVASAGEVLDDPEIQGVLIATPTDLRAEQIERAARAGKTVVCEKPVALDLDRARQSVTVAAECGVSLMIGFQRRFDPSFRRCARSSTAVRSATSSSCRSRRGTRRRRRLVSGKYRVAAQFETKPVSPEGSRVTVSRCSRRS